jgi:hypothetical protein
VDPAGDGDLVAASLAERIAELSFADREVAQVTDLLIETVVTWGRDSGWRVYRRAASVLPLPPPMAHRSSYLDVACARPAGPPIAVEVDHSDRRRTVDKLLAEAAAGRIAIWVRWGTGRFEPPPAPVHLVTCPVTGRRRTGEQSRRYSRVPATDRPAPAHSAVDPAGDGAPATQAELLGARDTP